MRYVLRKKNTTLFGNFSQTSERDIVDAVNTIDLVKFIDTFNTVGIIDTVEFVDTADIRNNPVNSEVILPESVNF